VTTEKDDDIFYSGNHRSIDLPIPFIDLADFDAFAQRVLQGLSVRE